MRGVAVLGILAINIAGFAGPSASTLTPHVPHAASPLDEIVFAGNFVLFEGKMRALFTILFGASLLLFIERAEAKGRDGEVLQLRRLGWLLVFGMLHYFLFWWGDILFIYGTAGILALFMRDLPTRPMLIAAAVTFIAWHLGGLIGSLPDLRAEEHVRLAVATANEARQHAEFLATFHEHAIDELAEYRLGYADQIGIKLSERPFWLIETTFPNLGETLPLVLIGMALLRSGFFAGKWPRRRLIALAVTCGAIGLALTLAMLRWLWERHFPPRAMSIALLYTTALPHLLMALAYAALLVLAAPRLAATWLGRRLIAAGRMAFTNYIATTVLMTAIFYGWGLGLVGTVGHAGQLYFVALGWVLMLGWSQPWLARFRQGPLEWLWRSLTELRPLPMRRTAAKLSENHLQ
ncbi:DUF418 domain-containing protein [Novosphingobium sp. G106]|nr:DUF418 domain-containing protein [Novosphingobium sp. G106]